MTYKQIYKALNNAGVIDEIIIQETQTYKRPILAVKSDIIDIINYIKDFQVSPSFYGMKYWYSHLKETEEQKSHARIYEAIVSAYCDYMIEESKKNIEAFTYYMKTVNHREEILA